MYFLRLLRIKNNTIIVLFKKLFTKRMIYHTKLKESLIENRKV